MSAEYILACNHEFAPAPDLIFILDVDVDVAIRRIGKRGQGRDEFEAESDLRDLRERFRSLTLPGIHLVDASQAVEAIHSEIFNRVSKQWQQLKP
ncbi:MAG: dTMP kinase [Verrucomicrobiota bacterium]